MTKGFSLIEMMIVVAIIGIVSAIAVPAYRSYVEVGRIDGCKREMAAIQLAQEVFAAERLTYFTGANVATIEANSGGYYNRTATFINGTSDCTISVVAGLGGIATQYRIVPIGRNNLFGKDLTGIEIQNY